jgi:DNA end-binding protein Ku
MRSVGSATISFGLIGVPVKIYLASAPEKSPFHWMSPKGNRVSNKCIDAITGEEIERADIQNAVDVGNEEMVVLTTSELESLSSKKDEYIELKKIVPHYLITPYIVEKTYYISPDKNQKPYRILQHCLHEMRRAAICKWYARGKDYLVAITPTEDNLLMMHQLFYKEELRKIDVKFSKNSTPTQTELELAKEIFESMSSDHFSVNQYHNEYNVRLLNLLEKKQNEMKNITSLLEETLEKKEK